MSRSRIAVAVCFLLCTGGHAQQFEVASIKPSSSNDPRTLLQILPGGGLRTSGATLKFLMTLAYQVRFFQIVGGPGWINNNRFDVIANSERSTIAKDDPPDPTKVTASELSRMQEEMRPRLVALLAERYKLQVHRETREEPVFELVVAKSGSRLQAASGNFGGFHISKNRFVGEAASIDMLVTALANQLDRPVLDRTGLVGTFNFILSWTAPGTAPPGPADGRAATDELDGPSIFTAVREQLGLDLRSAKGPAEVLIIDHVEKPSQN